MMLALLLRLAVLAVVLIGAALLFVYAFVAALILVPVLFILGVVLQRGYKMRWTVAEMNAARARPGGAPRVIDHDSDDVVIERRD